MLTLVTSVNVQPPPHEEPNYAIDQINRDRRRQISSLRKREISNEYSETHRYEVDYVYLSSFVTVVVFLDIISYEPIEML